MQKVFFRNSRGLRLAGILHTPEKPTNKAVLMAHGFTSDKDGSHGKFAEAAEAFREAGLAAFRFDFSGCGESDPDTITVSNQAGDLRSAVSLMRRKGYTELALLGSSLGGLDSILAYDPAIRTLVLWAPVTKAKVPHALDNEVAQRELAEKGFTVISNKKGRFRVGRQFLSERAGLDRKSFSQVKCPVLIVHGDQDDIIPLEHSREALAYFPEGSRLEVIEGANHHFTDRIDQLVSVTAEWLRQLL